MKYLKENEKILQGSWFIEDGKIFEDAVCQRINVLIRNHLIEIKQDVTGWKTLYKDPIDNRFWELVYKYSDWPGGGPPTLINIAEEEAKINYDL